MIVENQEYILDGTKRVKVIWKKYDKACILEVGIEYPTAIVDIDRLQGVPLNEEELIKLGFDIVRFREPQMIVGTDRFWKLDYAVMQINKGSGLTDTFCIRFNPKKFVLDNFYSVRFSSVHEVSLLLSILNKQ
jgi:hypothetical protein